MGLHLCRRMSARAWVWVFVGASQHVHGSGSLQVQDNACMVCGKEFRNPEDLVTLNGTAEEVSLLRDKLRQQTGMALEGKRHSKKRRRTSVETPQSLEQECGKSPTVLSLEGAS